MKSNHSPFVSSILPTTFLVLAALLPNLSRAAWQAICSPAEENDGYALFRVASGFRDCYTNDSTALAGVISNGDQWRRALFAFPLPDIDDIPRKALTRATLRLGYSGLESGAALGDVLLASLANAGHPGLFDTGNFDEEPLSSDTFGAEEVFLAANAAEPSTLPVWTELDVTARVQADLKAGRSFSTFRLRNAGEGLGGVGGRRFANFKYNGWTPQLVLETGWTHSTTGLASVAGQDARMFRLSADSAVEVYPNQTTWIVGDSSAKNVRAAFRLPLPHIPDGQAFDSASLQLVLESTTGTPGTGVELVCFRSDREEVSAADFDDTTDAVTIQGIFSPGAANGTVATVSGTAFNAWIRGEINAGREYAWFRLQLANGVWSNGDSAADYFLVRGIRYPHGNGVPVLSISTLPPAPPESIVILFR